MAKEKIPPHLLIAQHSLSRLETQAAFTAFLVNLEAQLSIVLMAMSQLRTAATQHGVLEHEVQALGTVVAEIVGRLRAQRYEIAPDIQSQHESSTKH